MRLEVGNNWGSLFYTYPGEQLNSSGTNETRNALQLREGMTIAVRFPDDWGAVVDLVPKAEEYRGSDMGREYMGTTQRWGFHFDVHGLQVWIPLESVEVSADFCLRRWELQRCSRCGGASDIGQHGPAKCEELTRP